MCTTRSVYPWDIIIVREGDKIFFDKRDTEDGPFGEYTLARLI
jgi:translation initiation factor 3 subunit D